MTNGRILASVLAHTTVLSMINRAGVFSYMATDSTLELDSSMTINKPRYLALNQAIESAVYTLAPDDSEERAVDF